MDNGRQTSGFVNSYGVDESGPLETGYFYELIALAENDEKIPEETKDWYSSVGEDIDCVSVTILKNQLDKLRQCKRNPSHLTGSCSRETAVEWSGGGVRPIMLGADFTVLIDEDLHRRLQETDLVGADAIEATVKVVHPITERPRLFVPLFPGRRPERQDTFLPPIPNACPFCKHGPLACTECNQLEFHICPRCKKSCIAISGDKPSAETNRRILIRRTPDEGHVLDASKWDGNDFCGGIITRRALDFLLKIHAYSFKAQPLRTFFGSCTPEQARRLKEKLTRPVNEKQHG